jgi:hypothetical protein
MLKLAKVAYIPVLAELQSHEENGSITSIILNKPSGKLV